MDIMVSIVCITYNHEKYIESALEGFISQKTTFEYEVLIHDDASTDQTASIINEYYSRYPSIIKPILQKENQWSKGINISRCYQFPRARGKYIALCEGDDYWSDPYKLQKQIDYLEANPACTFCFTNANVIDMETGKTERFIPYTTKDKKYYSGNSEIVKIDNIHQFSFVPTASFVFPKANLDRFPECFWDSCPTGDLKFRVFSTLLGYGYFIDEVTCVYRKNVPGSAMTRWKTMNQDAIIDHNKRIIQMLSNADAFSNYEHTNGIVNIAEPFAYELLKHFHTIKELHYEIHHNAILEKVYRKMSFLTHAKIIVSVLLPDMIVEKLRNFVFHR